MPWGTEAMEEAVPLNLKSATFYGGGWVGETLQDFGGW